MDYAIELAREILQKKEVKTTRYISIRSEDKEFLTYKDDYIEVVAGKNTQVLHITIYPPLTSGRSNPIIYVNDEGKCYRTHGERFKFIMYGERLLDKELTIGSYDWNVKKQEEIDQLFSKS